MWSVLGICILIWLGVGLIVGIKLVYIENFLDDMDEKIVKYGTEFSERDREIYRTLRGNKLAFLCIFMLLGVAGFYADTVRTFKKRKN